MILARYAVLGIFTMGLGIGCKGDPESEDSVSEKLREHLISNSHDLSELRDSWIIAAADVAGNEATYYIIDLRDSDKAPSNGTVDYDDGHIPGAVASSLGTVLDTAANNTEGKPILVVCHSGQVAAFAVAALRLSGHADAKVLKFGMSGWHPDFDFISSRVGDAAVSHASWSTDAPATPGDFAYPKIDSNENGGAAILAERIDAMLAGGFPGLAAADVLATPEAYAINNIWAAVDTESYGHIAGAHRVNETLTLADGGFAAFDPSRPLVTYCWTGQEAALVTGFMAVLGYDAKTIKFGANAMIHSELQKFRWDGPPDPGYTYE